MEFVFRKCFLKAREIQQIYIPYEDLWQHVRALSDAIVEHIDSARRNVSRWDGTMAVLRNQYEHLVDQMPLEVSITVLQFARIAEAAAVHRSRPPM